MKQTKRLFSTLSNRAVLSIVAGSAVVTGIASVVFLQAHYVLGEWWSGALQNFSTEMLGAFLTFILIDVVIGGRERRATEKQEELRRLQRKLIKKLRSPHSEITGSAAKELRHLGWLTDGSLAGAYLSYANLRGVDLSNANLEGARLTEAKLHDTSLSSANLEGTTLKASQLAHASSLCGSIMPDGRLYDGRLNLPGDIEQAETQAIDINEPRDWARFYGVRLGEYINGQLWAQDSLGRIRREEAVDEEKEWWQT